jgi:hypothetical protein
MTLSVASSTGSSIGLSWTNPVYYGSIQGYKYVFDHYSVYRKTGTSGSWTLQTQITSKTTMTWVDNSVISAETYSYYVLLVDAVELTSDSSLVFADWHWTPTIEVTVPSLTISSPNNGEQWQAGTTHSVTWSWTGSISSVKIELLKSGALDSTIVASTSNTGSYSWAIPSTLAIGSDYKVRITSTDGTAVSDESDSVFSVTGSITVVAPNGGESWIAGRTYVITWTSTGGGLAYVKIDLYRGGSYLSTLTPSTANDGSYDWGIPSNTVIAADYRVRIESAAYSTIADDSNGLFSVTGSLSLSSPVGGGSWTAGRTYAISWSSAGVGLGDVEIDLYKGGTLLSVIASSVPNNGTYDWAVPSTADIASDYSIRIVSNAYSSVSDMSEDFSIRGSLTIVSPTGGEEWAIGTAHYINWTTTGTGIGSLKIELYNGTSVVILVAASTQNNGSYLWTVPDSVAVGSYGLRVISNTDVGLSDSIESDLRIAEKPSKSIVSSMPNSVLAGLIVAVIVVALVAVLLYRSKRTRGEKKSKEEK